MGDLKEWNTNDTEWVSLKNMVNERSKTYKTTYYIIPFLWNVYSKQCIKTENRLLNARATEREEYKVIPYRHEISLWDNENAPDWDDGTSTKPSG